MNPLQMIGLLMGNPKQFINRALGNNPMTGNLINLVGNKDEKGIEQMARNLAKEKGKDADQMFNEIKSMLGM